MEMMDNPAINAADISFCRHPRDVGALLTVELDGPEVEVDYLIGCVRAIAEENGNSDCPSKSEEERTHSG